MPRPVDTSLRGRYIGRFAPSPTGPLHYGSLVAAVAGYLDARRNGGQWLLRIEDLDPPRESRKAPVEIMRQLEAYGLQWDGDVLYQSTRRPDYEAALDSIRSRTFNCICSRKTTPIVYPGTCRSRGIQPGDDTPVAVRLGVRDETLCIHDRVCGEQTWDMSNQVGDFIIRRKDGLFAYQLAVVVDDIFQGVTHIVRGRDLLDSTPRQLALYQALHVEPPDYAHLPIIVDAQRIKLSKQTHARPISTQNPIPVLVRILRQLGQPDIDSAGSIEQVLEQAVQNWDIRAVTGEHELREPTGIHESL